ncbi:MAG: bifunctional folylpolyglutamate synthase/dihydrofolate synthase [Deltaproteobacteria bacterium]|nr:bifunctional folylpolyglutamate synthase/dihydrofolate synthase [Deltaproteobacteria bacterium]
MLQSLPESLRRVAERRRFGVNPNLAVIQELLCALGDPQKAFPAIHLAGTNGKGSTAAMLAAALRADGFRVGLYTSPHLCRFNERIMVGGVAIDDASLEALAGEVLGASPEATFFEVATAMAMKYFARTKVDVAVIETGLGGRWDATNVLNTVVSVITSIALDHVGVLGTTLPRIAAEKAGIIKARTPVVSAPQQADALAVLQQRAAEQEAPFLLEGRDFTWESTPEGGNFQQGPRGLESVNVGLRGPHQGQNAALALATLGVLEQLGWATSPAAARRGVGDPQWPGRLEQIDQYLLDCAHNPAAAAALSHVLAADDRPTTLVFGALADKHAHEMLSCLAAHVEDIVLCAPSGERAGDPALLAQRWPQARIAASLREALHITSAAERVLITGSCYLVGEARALLLAQDLDGLADPAPGDH